MNSKPDPKHSPGVRGKAVWFLAVLAIAWAVLIVLPNFLKARNLPNGNSVVNNLRLIESAKDQWALEFQRKPGAVPTESEIVPYLMGGRMPISIQGETYFINPIGELPHAVSPVALGKIPAGGKIRLDPH